MRGMEGRACAAVRRCYARREGGREQTSPLRERRAQTSPPEVRLSHYPAGEVLDAADLDLPADVRAVADLILAAVAGHTAPDMVPTSTCGDWDLDALAEYLAVVQAVRREAILPRSVQGDTPPAPAPLAVREVIITTLPDGVSRVEVDGKVFVAHEGGA